MGAPKLYLDDLRVGPLGEYGGHAVTKDEIIAFAREYDPQPFHVDEEAAKRSIYGGLIASGWQTASLSMRLVVDGFLSQAASLGSPGVDQLRWLKPVRPGDTLSVRVEILEVAPSRSKPDRGSIRATYETLNQDREVVMTLACVMMFARRLDSA